MSLCGPNSGYFHGLCQALGQIHQFFDESFPVGKVNPLGPITFEGMDMIIAETQIVTPRESTTWLSIAGSVQGTAVNSAESSVQLSDSFPDLYSGPKLAPVRRASHWSYCLVIQ